MDMEYFNEYQFMVCCIGEKRKMESNKGGSRDLRPVQKNAIQKAKELKK